MFSKEERISSYYNEELMKRLNNEQGKYCSIEIGEESSKAKTLAELLSVVFIISGK